MLTIRGRLGGFCGWAPDVDGDTNWDAEFEGLGENDGVVGEALLTPELPRCLGLCCGDACLPFQSVANMQAADGELLIFEIAIEGSFAGSRLGHLNSVGGWSFDNGSV